MISFPKNGPIDSKELENVFNGLSDKVSALESELLRLSQQSKVLEHGEKLTNQTLANWVRNLESSVNLTGIFPGLRSQILSLASLNSVTVPDVRILTSTMFSPEVSFSGTVDRMGGSATLRTISKSNVLVSSYMGETVVPDDLSIEITDTEGSLDVEEGDLHNMVLDSTNTPYYRKVSFATNSPVDSVSFEVKITVPSSVTRGVESNLLEIIPFPLGVSRIDSIVVESTGGGTREIDLSGFSEVARKSSISIPLPLSIVGNIRIRVSNNMPVFDMLSRTFTYGLSKVGLYNVERASTGSFSLRMRCADGRRIAALNQVVANMTRRDLRHLVKPNSGEAALSLRVYAISPGGRSLIFDSSSTASGNVERGPIPLSTPVREIEVEGILKAVGGSVPYVYDVVAEVTAEADHTGLSVLSPPLPEAESINYSAYGERTITLPQAVSAYVPNTPAYVITFDDTKIKKVRIRRIHCFFVPVGGPSGVEVEAKFSTDSTFVDTTKQVSLILEGTKSEAEGAFDKVVDVEDGEKLYIGFDVDEPFYVTFHVEYEIMEQT